VSMTVPAGWLLGATGREQSRRDNADGTTTHRYVQRDVHDFAWTTSPDFVEMASRFEEPGLPAVDLRLLVQPEHRSQAERHFAAARITLRRYGTWFGPYLYGHLTIVDPAYRSGTGGMEYPTLFTAGTKWLVTDDVTLETPEEVVIHEVGHQFWHGLVGTNEFEHAWMDEGINTFATERVLGADYGSVLSYRYFFGGFIPWVFRDVPLRRETDLVHVWSYRRRATEEAIATPSYRQRPQTVITFAYDKPGIWLTMLERWLDWPVVQTALRRTFDDGLFAHPRPDVLLRNLQDAAGRDLTRFFDQTYSGSAVFDYAVSALSSARSNEGFETRVLVRRLGDGIFPVDLAVRFEDGETVRDRWDGEGRWREFTFRRASRARDASIDPDRVLLLDVNFTNNSRSLAPRAAEAARKWTFKRMVWLQDAFLTLGLFV
jgi:aminopeptidase N